MVQHDSTAVRRWLTTQVARYLDTTADRIAPHTPLAEYGLDSVISLTLCGDIEDHFGVPVEPTLAWDYPTIDAIQRYVLDALRSGATAL
ncbi:MAG TPA: acyl carrier protein [Rugosimonospora sp.]|jgi:acyl carrier protein